MEGQMGLLLLATAFSAALCLQMVGATAGVPAIYVFGDSSADVGNNNYLPGGQQEKANFPHNGIDYPFDTPTGRFTNGYNVIDFIAMKLRFLQSPPPYLSVTNDDQMFKGVNFASGGSGILDATGQNYSLSTNTQIKYFEGVTRSLKTRMGASAAGHFLSKSLFVFSTGNSDLFHFFLNSGLQNKTQGDEFIALLAYQFRNQLKTLYNLGARKFAVFGSTHLGCLPILRLLTPSGDCVEVFNEFSQQFNGATKPLLHDLASTLEGMSYAFVDAYEIVSTVISNPLKYGFTELKSACCGSGRFNAESACTPNVTYCSNRREYFFWDQYHPTQATYKLFALGGYHGGRNFSAPISIEQLAES